MGITMSYKVFILSEKTEKAINIANEIKCSLEKINIQVTLSFGKTNSIDLKNRAGRSRKFILVASNEESLKSLMVDNTFIQYANDHHIRSDTLAQKKVLGESDSFNSGVYLITNVSPECLSQNGYNYEHYSFEEYDPAISSITVDCKRSRTKNLVIGLLVVLIFVIMAIAFAVEVLSNTRDLLPFSLSNFFGCTEEQKGNDYPQEDTIIPVSQISLNRSDLTLSPKEKYDLDSFVSPDNATVFDVKWMSSDKSVAVVDSNGTVTAVDSGTAVITARTEDGSVSCDCIVFVESDEEEEKTITLGPWSPWTPDYPGGHDSIESKVQYRSREIIYQESTSPSLNGYTLRTDITNPEISYGSWGSVQKSESNPGNSDTVQVTNSYVSAYHYYHYCCNWYDNMWNVDSIACGSGPHYYHTLSTQWTLPECYGYDQGGQTIYGGKSSGCSPCSENFYFWFPNGTTTTYEYQTRKKITTYYFQKFGSWSAWSDSPASGDEVETRTLYRYRDFS